MTDTKRRAVLLVVIDALPWELAREAGFLGDLAVCKGPLKTVLGYSGAALPTLFSGAMPSEHGHWSMYYQDPAGSPFKLFKPLLSLANRFGGRGLARRLIEKSLPYTASIKGYYKLYDIPLDLLTCFSLIEKRDIFAPGGLHSARSLFDILEEKGLDHKVWTWRTPEEKNFSEMTQCIESRAAQVFFFYTPELDAVMHARGVFSRETLAKLKSQETAVAEAYRLAQDNFDSVSLLVFSDHGMVDVTEGHDLMRYVASRVTLRVPDDYLPFYDSTMARFWARGASALNELGKVLRALDYGRVLDRTELGDLGLDFEHNDYGEMVFLLEPGHVVAPSFMGRDIPAAMHGYHPDHPFSHGTFVSDRALEPEPTHIRDMFKSLVGSVDDASPKGEEYA